MGIALTPDVRVNQGKMILTTVTMQVCELMQWSMLAILLDTHMHWHSLVRFIFMIKIMHVVLQLILAKQHSI